MAMMLVVNRHTKWRNQWLDGGFIAIVLHTHSVPSAHFTNTHTHTYTHRGDTNMAYATQSDTLTVQLMRCIRS
ncbi:Uncharacterized protein APZ42_025780 [Daphnia magna]|uniref:Uncharacterized protein n=1 Tax=Daphnia magna TaxID=35525 RepID=A0A0P6DDU9_9CRUS|nr:Uncharacterized protein APZ42_025780 [Daphnia magna]